MRIVRAHVHERDDFADIDLELDDGTLESIEHIEICWCDEREERPGRLARLKGRLSHAASPR